MAVKQGGWHMISGKSSNCFNLVHFKRAFTDGRHTAFLKPPLSASSNGQGRDVRDDLPCLMTQATRSQRPHATQNSDR
jgi:hypothetical protein